MVHIRCGACKHGVVPSYHAHAASSASATRRCSFPTGRCRCWCRCRRWREGCRSRRGPHRLRCGRGQGPAAAGRLRRPARPGDDHRRGRGRAQRLRRGRRVRGRRHDHRHQPVAPRLRARRRPGARRHAHVERREHRGGRGARTPRLVTRAPQTRRGDTSPATGMWPLASFTTLATKGEVMARTSALAPRTAIPGGGQRPSGSVSWCPMARIACKMQPRSVTGGFLPNPRYRARRAP